MRVQRPVFNLLESLDLALALHDESESNGLHASGRDAAADLVPEQRRDLISDQAVEHTAGLLRVDEIAIDGARMLKGFLHRSLRDLVESDAMDDDLILAFLLLALLAVEIVAAQFFRQMRGNGLAFAV